MFFGYVDVLSGLLASSVRSDAVCEPQASKPGIVPIVKLLKFTLAVDRARSNTGNGYKQSQVKRSAESKKPNSWCSKFAPMLVLP